MQACIPSRGSRAGSVPFLFQPVVAGVLGLYLHHCSLCLHGGIIFSSLVCVKAPSPFLLQGHLRLHLGPIWTTQDRLVILRLVPSGESLFPSKVRFCSFQGLKPVVIRSRCSVYGTVWTSFSCEPGEASACRGAL